MATEYKLSYTASEIDNKLGQVEQLFEDVANLKENGVNGINGLPDVSTSDNGKFLRVVGGVWAVVSIPEAEGVSF